MSFPGMSPPSQPVQTLYKPVLLPDFIIGTTLALITVFADPISAQYKSIIRSDIGRIVIFGTAMAVLYLKGPLMGLLAAMAALSLTAAAAAVAAASAPAEENFADYQYRKYHNKHRWFVEEVLGENPKALETDKVQTISVQS